MTIHGSVVSLSFIFPHPPEDENIYIYIILMPLFALCGKKKPPHCKVHTECRLPLGHQFWLVCSFARSLVCVSAAISVTARGVRADLHKPGIGPALARETCLLAGRLESVAAAVLLGLWRRCCYALGRISLFFLAFFWLRKHTTDCTYKALLRQLPLLYQY